MSSKGLGKQLTADLVFTKTKSDSLQNIKNLNLWGNDLEDLSLIEKMPHLEVISLSVNRISSLKDFSHCYKLQELYLRKNNIADIKQIRYLVNLPTLKVLWLHDNPCAQVQNYREIVIKNLQHLIKLDNNPVTPEEKISSQNIIFSIETPKDDRIESNLQKSQKNSSKHRQTETEKQDYEQKPQIRNKNVSNILQEKEKSSKKQILPSRNMYNAPKDEQINRNQNILMAVLSLMNELDAGSLEIVRREAQKMLRS